MVYIYKTRKDYSRLVPVLMDETRTRIVSYPAPTDLKTNGKLASSWPNILTAVLLCFFIVLQSVFAKINEKNK